MRRSIVQGPPMRPAGLFVVSVLVGALFAGCVADPAPVSAIPTLVEAHKWASERARAKDRTALLVGFVANERLYEVPAPGWLLDQAGPVPAAGSELAEGRSATWVLLYATSDGRVLRAVVGDAADGVELEWIVHDGDPVAQALWGMNLGGRLLVDSDAAIEAARAADPDLRAHLEENPKPAVAVASTLAKVEDGSTDLVYAVFWGPPAHEEAFSRFAYVHHFTGDVVEQGDASTFREQTRVVLVDEEFALGPVPLEARQEEHLGFHVEDAVFHLVAEGTGRYTVRLVHENSSEAVAVEGVAALEPREHREAIGTMSPGQWALEVEVVGRVEFRLRIEGVVPVRPDQLSGAPDDGSDGGSEGIEERVEVFAGEEDRAAVFLSLQSYSHEKFI